MQEMSIVVVESSEPEGSVIDGTVGAVYDGAVDASSAVSKVDATSPVGAVSKVDVTSPTTTQSNPPEKEVLCGCPSHLDKRQVNTILPIDCTTAFTMMFGPDCPVQHSIQRKRKNRSKPCVVVVMHVCTHLSQITKLLIGRLTLRAFKNAPNPTCSP